jgi:hypothetical protein
LRAAPLREQGSTLSRLAAALSLLAFATWLGFGSSLSAAEAGEPGLIDLRSWHSLVTRVLAMTLGALVETTRHLPLGFLSVLSVSRPAPRGGRLLGVWVPSLLLALGLAAAAAVVRLRSLGAWPSIFDMALPALGVLVGTWLGMTWTRGWRARLLFVPKLALLLVAAGILGVAFVWLAVEREPLAFDPSPVTSAAKRQIHAHVREAPVIQSSGGEAREIRLTPEDLNVLLAWGLSLGETGRKARLVLDEDQATLEASARLPRTSRHLNVTATGRLRVEDGRPRVEARSLQVGGLAVPRLLLQPIVSMLAASLRYDRRVRPVLEAVELFTHDASGVTAVVRRRAVPRGLLVELVRGEVRRPEDEAGVRAQVVLLLGPEAAGAIRGDARFGRAFTLAFRLARERSQNGSALRENRSALLALGLVLGTPRLELLTGRILDETSARRAGGSPRGAALRGRVDWSRHFTVSGALTVLAFDAASDAAGLLKEELDADGGSGFSFGDLLADRAGTTFASRATRDEATARALQDRVAAGFQVDDYFPPADDLPEGIPDAELQASYGGVGGSGYAALIEEIERRLRACPGYR